ncbi:MAG TPA: PEP-utilizing enzyme [Candidatus Sulfomarinibacteraceae bacterium]|nr:PEP-utilizing enzyme [Candidatus Sulfomarinibacteraceae bacterium]
MEPARAVLMLSDGPLSVRSSGVAEDGPDPSLTGPYGTVQRLVRATAAGVAFTADPVTGDRDVVRISAVPGLAQGRLAAGGDGEEWVVPDDGPLEAGAREIPIPWPVTSARERFGRRPKRVRSIAADVLSRQLAGRIARGARQIERLRAEPQEIEWAIEDGEIRWLQARPITGLPTPPDGRLLAEHGWWCDIEHHARPLPAFAAKVTMDAENAALDHAFQAFGFLRERSCYVAVGGMLFGRRIQPVGFPPIGEGPGYARALAASPPVAGRAAVAAAALADGLPEQLVERWHATWRDDLVRQTASLRDLRLAPLDDEALISALDASIELYRAGTDAHFMTWAPYYLALHGLELVCRELLGWGSGESLALLVGSSASTSEPTRALQALAERIAGVAAAVKVLDAGGNASLARLRKTDPGVQVALDDVLARFGGRPLDGDDPRSPTLAERPEVVVGLLRNLVHRARNGGPPTVATAIEAEHRATAVLANRPDGDRDRFERALRFARRAYETRDGTILWGCEMPMGALRRIGLEIGERLVERRAIGRPEDVFHLEPDELRSVVRSERMDGLAIVARRRAEEAWVLAHLPPAEIGEIPALAYRTDALPDALRRIHAAFDWRSEMEAQPSRVATRNDRVLAGVAGSPGRHSGTVRLVRGEADFGRVEPGDVMVCSTTTPAWAPLFGTAGALVTDVGDVLAHGAILAREHGIPAVLATGDATRRLRDGSTVVVDGSVGIVTTERSPGRPDRDRIRAPLP